MQKHQNDKKMLQTKRKINKNFKKNRPSQNYVTGLISGG
jgi:hypothetical protein